MTAARIAARPERPITVNRAAEADVAIGIVAPAPTFPSGFVRRPALVARLLAATTAELALVVAPPGFGKSTLLSEWVEQDPRRCVWLGLCALEPGQSAVESLNELTTAVLGADRGLVVVIDDAQLIAPELLRSAVGALLGALPSDSTVALASRSEPELPTGRLRAHRKLVEIRTGDLVMDHGEASALLQQAGLTLERDAVDALVTGTAGWPAALYLAALSARECPNAPDGVAGFRGDDHLVTEYLRDEVLAGLPPKLLTFATRSSVPDQPSGPMCDAVLKDQGSALKLRRLARATGLLEPTDRAHTEYRWHPLLRDCLRSELRIREPALERRLEHRASKWCAAHGDLTRAIEHGCAAGAAKQTGRLLWDHILAYLTVADSGLVQRWLGSFCREEIASCAPLAMCAAHSALVVGRLDEAQRWAVTAAGAAEESGAPVWDGPLAGGFAVIEAITARTGAAAMRSAADRGFEHESPGSQWRPLCRVLSGVAAYLIGEANDAVVLLTEAYDLAGAAMPSVSALSLAERAMIAIEQHDWELAGELGDRAGGVVAARRLEHKPAMALVFAVCAAARAHDGRVDEAKRDLRRGLDLLAALGDYASWYCAQTSILLAYASLWLADVVGARTLLAQASRFARRIPDAAIFGRWFDDAWSYLDTLAEASLAGPSSLTIAELRILRFLPSHRSFREIADQLGVSSNTVKTQAHAVYRKLGAASRSEAVTRAIDAGLLGQ
jgi:LuxR family maltose regulon positive regulatory protein